MRDTPSILTLGDMVLDVFVAGVEGETRDAAGTVHLIAGGSAANFAVGVAKAGARATMIGRVGDDVSGRLLVAELARAGVVAVVQVDERMPTGHVLVVRDGPGGTSRMISEPGASLRLDPGAFDERVFDGVDAFHLTGYSLFRSGPDAAARAAHAAVRTRSPAALTTCDPGPAYLVAGLGVDEARARLASYGFDVLFPNFDEGAILARSADPRAIVRSLRELAPVVVLTMGGDGCLVSVGDVCEPMPAERTVVVDTTGAGDAFAAAFVASYARVRDAVAAAHRGTEAAAAIVARIGSRP